MVLRWIRDIFSHYFMYHQNVNNSHIHDFVYHYILSVKKWEMGMRLEVAGFACHEFVSYYKLKLTDPSVPSPIE